MNTKLWKSDAAGIAQAGAQLAAGEVVGIPTETVYGLAANAWNAQAVQKIFAAKGRPADNPLIVHIADFEAIFALTATVPPEAIRLAQAFWPGPLTMILPKAAGIPNVVSAGLDTIGIRLPAHPVARALIREAGVPLAAPSANVSGRPSTTTAAHVMEDMDGKIAGVVDGGPCAVGVESTVISLAGTQPHLLRPGGISLEQLQAVLGTVTVDRATREQIGAEERVSAPGMKYRHYAPKAPVMVVCGPPAQTAAYIAQHSNAQAGVLCFDEFVTQFAHRVTYALGPQADSDVQAQRLFDALRAFDTTAVTTIWAQCPADTGIGWAVANRLKKAAGFQVIVVE